MWQDLLRALALVFIIEGLTPFLAPGRWREAMLRLCQTDDKSLRMYGGIIVAIGLVLLQFF